MRSFVAIRMVSVVVVLAFFVQIARATGLKQDSVNSTHSAAKVMTSNSPAQMNMPLIAPLFIQDQNFTSTLVLVNSTKVVGVADVTLRNRWGSTITEKKITVQPKSDLRVSVATLLEGSHPPETPGSISLVSMAGDVAAQLSLTYVGGVTPSYIDEEFAMPMPDSSPILRGVADSGQGFPLLAVTSTASVTEHITMACLTTGTAKSNKMITLTPNATVLTNACDESASDDIENMIASPKNNVPKPTGIELQSDGPPGGFAAFGIMGHGDEDEKYFSALSFSDPMMLRSSTTVYAGVPVGSAPLLSSGRFKPEVALANFATKAARVTISLATTVGSDPKTTQVATVNIPGEQTVRVVLPTTDASPQLQNSFLVTANASAGSVISKLVAIGDGQLREVELLGKDLQDLMNAGHHPWSLRDGSDSVLLLFNHSTVPQQTRVVFSYTGGAWQKNYTLKPMQTAAIDLQSLVDQQTKDENGNIFPTTLTDGVVSWGADPSSVSGRLLESNSRLEMARSFSCGIFYYVINQTVESDYVPVMINGPTTVSAGSSPSFTALPEAFESFYRYCDIDGQDADQWYYGSLTYWWQDMGPYDGLSPTGSADSTYSPVATLAGREEFGVTVYDAYNCQAGGTAYVTVYPTISSLSAVQGLVGTAIPETIVGAGFISGSTSVNAGPNIAVSNVSVSSWNQLTATFTPTSSSSAGGYQTVTVTVNGLTSGSSSFYNQIPTRLTINNLPGAELTVDDVYDYYSDLIKTNVCGVYRNVQYNLLDQSGSKILGGDFYLTENFSNYSTTVTGDTAPTSETSNDNTAVELLIDTQGYLYSLPYCPGPSDSESFDQTFVITVPAGSINPANQFPLSTVVHIDRGYYSGDGIVNIIIQTP